MGRCAARASWSSPAGRTWRRRSTCSTAASSTAKTSPSSGKRTGDLEGERSERSPCQDLHGVQDLQSGPGLAQGVANPPSKKDRKRKLVLIPFRVLEEKRNRISCGFIRSFGVEKSWGGVDGIFCDVNLISCTIHTFTLKVNGTKKLTALSMAFDE